MTGAYDDLPVEVRRDRWGWFGEPWPSGVCFDDDDRLREEMRKPFPSGESCLYCAEVFIDGDQGQATPLIGIAGTEVCHVHRECMLRQVVGGLAHLEGRCSCYGGDGHETPGMTEREEAIEVWKRWTKRQT